MGVPRGPRVTWGSRGVSPAVARSPAVASGRQRSPADELWDWQPVVASCRQRSPAVASGRAVGLATGGRQQSPAVASCWSPAGRQSVASRSPVVASQSPAVARSPARAQVRICCEPCNIRVTTWSRHPFRFCHLDLPRHLENRRADNSLQRGSAHGRVGGRRHRHRLTTLPQSPAVRARSPVSPSSPVSRPGARAGAAVARR